MTCALSKLMVYVLPIPQTGVTTHAETSPQTDVEESPVDLVNIAVAQRYSVLVTARNDTSSNWVMHANMDTDMFDTVPPNLITSMFLSLPPSFWQH